jgi:DNA-binding XRE family transcriptional regulator
MSKQGGWPSTGFGGRLRKLREEAGLSQQQLADLAACNRFTVAKLERGTQEPAWPLVLALAKALGVTCEAFNAGLVGVQVEKRPRGRPRREPIVGTPGAGPAPQRPPGRPKKNGREK